ncbi:helix-turn-helix transcriptional regulator [Aurantiacibacter aquimixticola]|uniref:LuxR family transcriptional regulator n=1 Tax=Aurantiacibacter aquimixticola TaxID=1958945 RepID=A0A419RVM0_9SPHN|nr:helix-turn-helix transcriptional regulator [Aurantiacibacter aquimixticola]RJY09814.1 LuxR family transcriptional regulator [Aurantiacibacter aquimixticola]
MSEHLESHHRPGRDDITVFASLAQADIETSSIKDAFQALLCGLERIDGRARFIVDRAGRLQAESPRTRDAVQCVDAISLKDDRLSANGNGASESLAALLALEPEDTFTIMRRSSRMDGHCIFRGVGLCERSVLVTVQCAHPHCETELADLTEAFGLTPSEAHIVELLMSGHCPVEIASKLGVSVNTVRAHVRHCYDKMDVSSREELWRTVSPYRLR